MKNLSSYFSFACALALPLLNSTLLARMIYIATVPDLLPPLVSVAIGVVLGTLVCVVFIPADRSSMIEFNVVALIIFVLLVTAYPMAAGLPAKRRANLQKRALKAKHQQLPQQIPTSTKHP